MFGLISPVVVAGAEGGPCAVGVGDGVHPAEAEQLLVGGVTHRSVAELVIGNDVSSEDELHSEECVQEPCPWGVDQLEDLGRDAEGECALDSGFPRKEADRPAQLRDVFQGVGPQDGMIELPIDRLLRVEVHARGGRGAREDHPDYPVPGESD